MPVKYPSVYVQWVVGHRNMEFKGKVWTEDINLGVKSIQVIFLA